MDLDDDLLFLYGTAFVVVCFVGGLAFPTWVGLLASNYEVGFLIGGGWFIVVLALVMAVYENFMFQRKEKQWRQTNVEA